MLLSKLKVSIVIPVKNAGLLLQQVIDSVLNQSVPWEYDVLVIDSGSTDGTVDYIKSLEHVRLHQIKPEDFSHGKTRNLGVSLTSGEFVVMMTHDALPASDKWLFELVSAVEQSDCIAGSFGRHLAYGHHGPLITRDLTMHFDGFLNMPLVSKLEDKKRYDRDVGYRQVLHFFSDNNACLRRSVWEKIPYPEVDFAEDQLWAQQIIEAGYSKAYSDKAVVYHSHRFGPVELFRRSFDEARALKRLFGYELCPTVTHMIGLSFWTTLNDMRFLRREGSILKNFKWLLSSPFQNIAKQVGFYLGQRSDSFPAWFILSVSRDMSIKRKG